VAFTPQRHLPRLDRAYYRGLAFVHWVLAIEDRKTGWLNDAFHHAWASIMVHTTARYQLACPAYVLMPDHMHLLWLGFDETGSDQRIAIEFLTKHLRPHIKGADFQRQPYDHVLREDERNPDAFLNVAGYILDNPIRSSLVTRREDWPYLGCCIAGYPALDVRAPDYWEQFWRIYYRVIERGPLAHARSHTSTLTPPRSSTS
jgi:putative transposase